MMSRRPRRNHSPAFKAKVAIAAIKGDRTIAQICRAVRRSSEPGDHLEGAARRRRRRCFRWGTGTAPAAPAVDVKQLHAKIGELTLENDFLEGALTKAGLLSARR